MGLWTLVEGLLLLLNAVAILNEERFLARRGWGFNDMTGVKSLKGQIIGFVHAVQYLRFPLIFLNTVVAISMLISG